MHPSFPNQIHPSSHYKSKITIFHIADKIIKCLKQAQENYFFEDATNLSKFDVGQLVLDQDIYLYPIQPKPQVFVHPIKFLETLMDALISRMERVYEEDQDCIVIIFSRKKEKICIRIFKDIESENFSHRLKLESSAHGILKVVLKQTSSISLFKRIEDRLKDKNEL